MSPGPVAWLSGCSKHATGYRGDTPVKEDRVILTKLIKK